MEKERLINPAAGIGDDRVDQALRPKRLAEVTGQDQVRENLAILLCAAATWLLPGGVYEKGG